MLNVIRWTERVFGTGVYPQKQIGERTIEAEIVREIFSKVGKKTLRLRVLECVGVNPLAVGSMITRRDLAKKILYAAKVSHVAGVGGTAPPPAPAPPKTHAPRERAATPAAPEPVEPPAPASPMPEIKPPKVPVAPEKGKKNERARDDQRSAATPAGKPKSKPWFW